MFCPVCSVYREIFCVCVVVCCDFEKCVHFYVPSFVGGVVLVASLCCCFFPALGVISKNSNFRPNTQKLWVPKITLLI